MKASKNIIKAACVGLLLLTNVVDTKAQYDAMFTQYMFNEMFINPAMPVVAMHYQQQRYTLLR